MPAWVTIVIAAGAVVTALGILWTKALKPAALTISAASEMVPLARRLVELFGNDPTLFDVIHDFAAQFRNNNGSSMRDVVDRLEKLALGAEARASSLEHDLATASATAKATADVLKVNVEAAKQLAEHDRRRISELLMLLGRVSANVDTSKVDVKAITDDLQAGHERAEAHEEHEPGSAADAFSKRPGEEES